MQGALAGMDHGDRTSGVKLHAISIASAPDLRQKSWYGRPAYAHEEGKGVRFYRNARKFVERDATLGFNDVACLDNGTMCPNGFALTEITAADEQAIAALVKQVAG